MKTFWIIASFVLFTSCISKTYDERDIVGKYFFSMTIDDDDASAAIEGIVEYNEDKITTFEGIVKLFDTMAEDGYFNSITVEYQFSASGTWKVEGSYLIEKIDPQAIKINFIGSSAIYEDEWATLMQGVMKQQEAYLQTGIREEYAKSGPSKIIEVTEDKLILEDEDGEQVIYTRIESNSNQAISEKKAKTKDESLSFDDFIKKFISDKDYQLSHIKFPLPDIEDPMEETIVPAPTKESWEFISSDLFFIGEKEINGTKLSGRIEKRGQYVDYSLGYVESELVLALVFGKIDGVWMLIEYMEF